MWLKNKNYQHLGPVCMDVLDEQNPQKKPKSLPFNNLYLNSGVVHGSNQVWMYLITLTFLITGYVLFQSIILVPLMDTLLNNGYTRDQIFENSNLLFDSDALRIDKNVILLLELGMFVFAFLGFYLGLRFFHKKPLISVLSGYDKFRYGRFWFAFAVWGLMITVLVLLEYFLGGSDLKLSFNPIGMLVSCLIMIVFMPVQTGIEEIVFRGYLLQGLSQIFKNGLVPLIITSLVFGLAHMSNPEVAQYGWPIMLTYYCMFALFMGLIVLVDEGLELALGIHFANNFISSVLVSSSHSVIKTYSLFETKQEDPYGEILSWVLMATLAFLIFLYRYRWKNFKLILR